MKKDKEEKTFIKALSLAGEGGVGSNPVMVDIKDGKIVRLRPLHYDWKYTPEELGCWEMKARGKTIRSCMKALVTPFNIGYKKRVYSPNRVRYPLKRVDWDPDGNRHPEKRGESKYVRISWDEALNIIVSEIERIKKKYGTTAILAQADGHGETKIVHPAHACNVLLLKHLGGYTLQTRNPDSWEGWYWGAKHVWGMDPVGLQSQLNLVPEIAENTELMLHWGCDEETTPWGFFGQMSSRLSYWFTEIGIKAIYVSPDLNYAAAVHADKWIPVFPNTDAALQLAIAYVWLTEEKYDKEYVATHTFGFDRFSKYVLGKEDGVPKTPEWASEKCGVPEWTIKALAREWAAKTTSTAHMMGGGLIRGPYSTEPARLEVLLLAMQGLGKPGVNQFLYSPIITDPPKTKLGFPPSPMTAFRGTDIAFAASEIHGDSKANFVTRWNPGGWGIAGVGPRDYEVTPEQCRPTQIIPKDMIHQAILNSPISWYGTTLWAEPLEDQFVKYTYPAKGCPEIHMMWTDTPCWITCWNDSNKHIKALRSPKIEFILAQQPWMENDCQFADIILPVSTKLEQEDINIEGMGDQYDVIFPEKQCIEPVGESKSDYEIVCLIAERLGLLEKVTEGKSVEEWIRFGFDNSGVSDLISYEGFQEKGYYAVPANPQWRTAQQKLRGSMRNFYEDPEKNPVKTPSGKIEFYSQNLAKHFPDDKERPPVPHWIPFGESHQESLQSERAEKYPLLIVTNHPRWRVHAQLDDVNWFHEIKTCKVRGPDGYLYEPLWINPKDAADRNVSNGVIIKIYNERGAVLGGAYVTERILPGVVSMDHGARYDPIVVGELDRGGAINTITPGKTISKNATGMVCEGFLVEVERADLDGLRKKYPAAFKRPYHPDSGLVLKRVLSDAAEQTG